MATQKINEVVITSTMQPNEYFLIIKENGDLVRISKENIVRDIVNSIPKWTGGSY